MIAEASEQNDVIEREIQMFEKYLTRVDLKVSHLLSIATTLSHKEKNMANEKSMRSHLRMDRGSNAGG